MCSNFIIHVIYIFLEVPCTAIMRPSSRSSFTGFNSYLSIGNRSVKCSYIISLVGARSFFGYHCILIAQNPLLDGS